LNKALLDTDIYSEVLKAVNQTVKANAVAYRKAQGVLTLSAVTLMEITQGHHQKQAFPHPGQLAVAASNSHLGTRLRRPRAFGISFALVA
jgi:hypothetical protein